MSGLVSFFSNRSNNNYTGGSSNNRKKNKKKKMSYHDSIFHSCSSTPTTNNNNICPQYPLDHVLTPFEILFQDWLEFNYDWINVFMSHRLLLQKERPPQKVRQAGIMNVDGRHQDLVLTIPHYQAETLHAAKRLGDLNLRTRHIELGVLQVQKVYGLREPRRVAVKYVVPKRQVQYTNISQHFVSMGLAPCQNDGPMAAIYSNVMNVEVTQLLYHKTASNRTVKNASAQLRQLADAAMTSDVTTPYIRRMSIYFYGSYAKTLESIWNEVVACKKTSKKNLLLSSSSWHLELELHNVSAVSVLPDPAGATADWVNRHNMARFCLCFGDESYLRFDNKKWRIDGWTTAHANGQEEGLRIHVRLVNNNTEVEREWEICPFHSKLFKELPKPPKRAREGEPLEDMGNKRHSDLGTAVEHHALSEPNHPSAVTMAQDSTTTRTTSQGLVTAKRARQTMVPDSVAPSREPQTPDNHNNKKLCPAVAGGEQSQRFSVLELLGRQASGDAPKLYHYHKLGELMAHFQSCSSSDPNNPVFAHVFGVVLGMGCPRLCKSGQWMMSVALVDETLETHVATLNGAAFRVPVIGLNMFAGSKEGLPKVLYCGDVLRIHRAMVQLYQGEVQLVGTKSKGASYLCFRKNVANNTWAASSPDKQCTVAQQNDDFLSQLWDWGKERIFKQPTIGPDRAAVLASSSQRLDEWDEFDVTVMLTVMVESPPGNPLLPVGFIRVWDGTGAESDPYPMPYSQVAMPEGDPPPVAIARLGQVVEQLRQRDERWKNLSTPEAVSGRVANFAIWENAQWDLIQQVFEPGSFIRLRNVREKPIQTSGNAIRFIMTSNRTHLTPLPDMTFEVAYLIEEHDKRIKRKDPINPQSGVLPLDMEDYLQRAAVNANQDGSSGSGKTSKTVTATETNAKDKTQVTSSLSDFRSMHSNFVVFTGIVRIVDTIPALGLEQAILNSFLSQGVIGLKLEQGGNGIDVIMEHSDSSLAAVRIKDLLENLVVRGDESVSQFQLAIQAKRLWKAVIFASVFQGCKYYVLDSLELRRDS